MTAGAGGSDTEVPDTEVPDTAVPDTAVPDTAVPDTTTPDTTMPDLTTPDTTVSEATAAAGAGALPALDFSTFILSMLHQGLVHLGDAADPTSGRREANLPLAQQTIDLLGLFQEKTRGNLTGGEERVLAQALYDLKLRLVEVAEAT